MSTTHNKIAMSPEELPRQRLFQLLELPEQPEGFELLSGDALRNLRPEEPGDGIHGAATPAIFFAGQSSGMRVVAQYSCASDLRRILRSIW